MDRARALLDDIGWNDVEIHPVAGGTVNRTFRLARGSETWFLRIGPTEGEANDSPTWFTSKGLRREQQAIAHWKDHARYLPETVHTDFSRNVIASDWVIQKAIPGEPWSTIRDRLTPQQTNALWRQLGTLMAKLHSYVGTEFGPPEPGTGLSRWSELVRWDATGMLTDANRYDLPLEPFEDLCELVDRSSRTLDEVDTPRLIHSDLGTRHVLVRPDDDGEPVIAGLIDLEFARFADAYSESVFTAQALQAHPDPGYEQFLDAYGAERSDRSGRLRSSIYQLTALGWWVTDAMRRNRRSEAMQVLDEMRARLANVDET